MNKNMKIETPEDVRKKVWEIHQRHSVPLTEKDKLNLLYSNKSHYLCRKYDESFMILYVAFAKLRKEFYLDEQRGEIESILNTLARTLGVKEPYKRDYIGSCQAKIERVFEEFLSIIDEGWRQHFFNKIRSLHTEIISELLGKMCKDCLEGIEEKPAFIERGLMGVSEFDEEIFRERDEAIEKVKRKKA